MTGYTAGNRQLAFNAGLYRLAEISLWSMARQQYQIIDDMFGRLIPTNEPFLVRVPERLVRGHGRSTRRSCR